MNTTGSLFPIRHSLTHHYHHHHHDSPPHHHHHRDYHQPPPHHHGDDLKDVGDPMLGEGGGEGELAVQLAVAALEDHPVLPACAFGDDEYVWLNVECVLIVWFQC